MGSGRRRALGEKAERRALEYLVRNGLTLVDRNFRRRGGEIDLIMQHRDCLVFIEVRFRSSTRFSRPELTVDARKQQKLMRAAALYITAKPHYATRTVRFDVVAIDAGHGERIRWIRDAFRPRDSTL